MTSLTLDLGTSATKAAIWDGAALVALTRVAVETTHPAPGLAEQDPESWWTSVVDACAAARSEAPHAYAAIDVIGFSAARETFALFDEQLRPLGPGVLWSDRRAGDFVDSLGDPIDFRRRTGVMATAGCCAAKVRWVETHEADAFAAARWLLAPRDLVVARLTGTVTTDETLASRTGLYALDGELLATDLAGRLPPVHPATDALAAGDGAGALHLAPGVRVVLGAGDRACEVLGVGASASTPMLSWGTTANASVPHPGPIDALPEVAQVSRGALGGFLVEAGLSSAGAALAWLSRLTGRSHDELLTAAASVPPGANGLFALPWLSGARAPWWQPEVHASFIGLTEVHGAPEMARAIIEGIAYDVARCVEMIAPDARELALAGGGATDALWREVAAAITRLPVRRRTVDDAASVGALLVTDRALAVDDVNPVVGRDEPDASLVAAYGSLRETADAIASAVIRK